MTVASTAIPILAGPTASGKTSISLDLAKSLDAEIISADSRQIYKGLTIGTAMPTSAQLDTVRHHFIGELDPGESYSAGIFARATEERIGEISTRSKNVIITGGSTLYVHSLYSQLADIPDIDPSVRSDLNERILTEGSSKLYRELVSVDPDYAATLDESKTHRLVRGLEVFVGTGQTLSSFYAVSPSPLNRFALFILFRPREALYARINERVDVMMEEGLLEETRSLIKQGGATMDLMKRTIGYQELISVVDGSCPVQEAVELIKRNSRRYAKRQLTWYRRYEHATWIDIESCTSSDAVEQIGASLKKRG